MTAELKIAKCLTLFEEGTTSDDLLELDEEGHIDLTQMLKMEWVI